MWRVFGAWLLPPFLYCFVWRRRTQGFNCQCSWTTEGAFVLKLGAHGKGLPISGGESLTITPVTEKDPGILLIFMNIMIAHEVWSIRFEEWHFSLMITMCKVW